ncbi:MAG: TIGR04086 family membrane protein [Clostridiaceae bacterium]|nr:TIGR04086 family membrane protein [Clostridiaceae bacterium]
MINKSQAARNIINEHANIVTVAKGILISYLITIPIFALFAYILTFVDFPEKYMSTAVIITTLLSMIIAGWTAAKNMKSRGWLNGAVIGVIYMGVLFLLSSLAFRNFSIDRHVAMMLIIGILSGSIGGILGVNLTSQPRIKTRK